MFDFFFLLDSTLFIKITTTAFLLFPYSCDVFAHLFIFNLFHYFRCVFLLTRELNPLMLLIQLVCLKYSFIITVFIIPTLSPVDDFAFQKVFLWYLGIFAFLVLVVTFTHSCVYLRILKHPKSLSLLKL